MNGSDGSAMSDMAGMTVGGFPAASLALNQWVATPANWITIGALRVGDLVFDEDGAPQPVIGKTEVSTGLKCYEVVFDDGESVVASAWQTWTVSCQRPHGDRHEITTVTTTELVVLRNRTSIRIPLAPRLTNDIGLPIAPYLLGYWLGDGQSKNGNISVGYDDYASFISQVTPLLEDHEDIGTADYPTNGDIYTVNVRRKRHLCPRGHDKAINPLSINGFPGCRECARTKRREPVLTSLHEKLKAADLISNKHIPAQYLFAGTDQRRALLQGLMDSDGCITKEGRALFTNTKWPVIDGFVELALSLGYHPRVRTHGTSGWIVSFNINSGEAVCRLPRKQARVIVKRNSQSLHRYVNAVVPIPSVPVQGIQLDTASRLFQVAGGVLVHTG